MLCHSVRTPAPCGLRAGGAAIVVTAGMDGIGVVAEAVVADGVLVTVTLETVAVGEVAAARADSLCACDETTSPTPSTDSPRPSGTEIAKAMRSRPRWGLSGK